MGKLSFLKEKKFYINLLVIILLCFVILFLTIRMLGSYTRHDKVFELPDFRGYTEQEMYDTYGRDYHFILIDSVYSKTEAPGTVVQQDPLPLSKVKHGRNVYYIVVAQTPEKTIMPNLNNLSLREALVRLESSGLQVEKLVYVEHFARNAICEQRYDGSVIKPGTELTKGSKITLNVGIGTDQKKMRVPNLYGVNAEDVQHILNLAGLNLGEETYENRDSIQYMMVYKMDPPFSRGQIAPGTAVNVWYRSSKEFDFDKEKKSMMLEDSIHNAESLLQELDSLEFDEDDINEEENDDYEDEF